MKKSVLTLTMIALVAVINGCGKGGDNQIAGVPDTAPVQPNGCAAGSYPSQYGCLPQGNCAAGQVTYNNQCITPNNNTGTGTRFGANMQISNRDLFEKFLAATTGCVDSNGWLYGSFRCKNFSSRGYVVITGQQSPADGAAFVLTIGGSGGLVTNVQTTYRASNNNQGFNLSDGSFLNYPSRRIRLEATTGSLAGNSPINVVLSYDNQVFANAVVERY